MYPRSLPFICGQEGGGTIESILYDDDKEEGGGKGNNNEGGKTTTLMKEGDVVMYSYFGSYAEYTLVPIDKLIPIPNNIPLRVAIACMVQGLTAHYLVTSAHAQLIQQNEWCLIYSVGSGTGQWAAQMAKLRGYRVIGTCSKSKIIHATTNNQCCDEIIVLDEVKGKSYSDYNSVDIVSQVMKITNGDGVKCIIDGVGKSTSDISLQCLARRGIWISFGNASGKVDDLSLLRLVQKSAFVTRPKLNDYVATRDELLQRINEVFEWVQDQKLHIVIDQEFNLNDAVSAHQYIENGESKGKLLFKIG